MHAAPTIGANGIVNSADQASAADAGIPRGGVFTIYGTEFAPREAQAPAVPLPTTLSTVRVRISAPSPLGVRDYYAPLHYVSPHQINAVLPSILPEGTAQLRVVVNSVPSEPVNIEVVHSRFSAFTWGGMGFGPAIAQQYDGSGSAALNLFRAPARPGNAVVLWGTGLGPVTADEDASPVGRNLRDDITIYAGGVAVKPVYAGRAPGLPGVDQINFYLPEGASDGCFTPLLVEVAGVSAALLTFSAGSEGNRCVSEFGLPETALASLDEGKRLRVAVVNHDADPGQAERQSVQAWVGEYDAAHLSLLATTRAFHKGAQTAWCEQRAYTRSRSQAPEEEDALYGVRVLENVPLNLRVTGDECAWGAASGTRIVEAPPNRACVATDVELTMTVPGQERVVTSGELPELPATVVRNFATVLSGERLRATWEMVADDEDDYRAAVTIGSTFTLPGNIFSGATTVREVSCRLPASEEQSVFSREQTAWARGLQTQTPPALEVSRTGLRAVEPSAGELSPRTVDLVLLRTRTGVSATAN